MSELPLTPKKHMLILPKDYPFMEDVIRQQNQGKSRTYDSHGYIEQREVTIRETRRVVGPGGLYTKMFHNREVLKDLSPSACRVMIDIALNMDWLSPTVILKEADCLLSKVTFYKALTELMMARIITKQPNKKESYWVNVAILFMGTDTSTELKEL